MPSQAITFDENSDLTVVSDAYYQQGLLIVKNKQGYVGLYSLHYGKYLVSPMFISELIQDYEVLVDSNVGYYVCIQYKNIYYVWDALGNLVYNSDVEIEDFGTRYINDQIYLTIETDEDIKFYQYTSVGLSEVTELPVEIDKEVVEEKPEEDDSLAFGDLFVGDKLDLSSYGLEGHYIVNSGNLSVFFFLLH